jgi:sensor histidine kinase YesM
MSVPTISRSRATALFALWWVIWAAISTAIVMQAGWTWREAMLDSALLSIILGISCYATNTSLLYFQPTVRVALLTALVTLVFAYGLIRLHAEALAPLLDANYLRFYGQTVALRVTIAWLLMMMTAIPTLLWSLMVDQKEMSAYQKEVAQLAREAELTTLRQQLQPHFIFNSLNSINALIGTQPEKARTMVQQLSDFLRGSLRKEEKQLVTLREELHYLQLYLDIEKVRFGHRLVTSLEYDPACLELKMPSLLLQPIVENAIKFGLYDMTDEILISLRAQKKDNELELIVKNPFDPDTAEARKGTGFGLSSISRRLYLLYARNDLMQTTEDGNLFIATVRLPQAV